MGSLWLSAGHFCLRGDRMCTWSRRRMRLMKWILKVWRSHRVGQGKVHWIWQTSLNWIKSVFISSGLFQQNFQHKTLLLQTLTFGPCLWSTQHQSVVLFPERRFVAGFFRRLFAYLTPHISHTYPAHHTYPTYPFQTYPPHISHTYRAHRTYPTHIHSKRIPPIRIPPVRIHAMRIHSKGCNTYPTNHHTYPIHIQHIIHIPHISIPNVSLPNVSHQYVSIANVSIQKVCISRRRKRIPPIHIPPIRIFNTYPTSTDPFNAYPFKKFASAGMAMSMSITANHFIPLLLGGNGNEYKNFAFPQFFAKLLIEYNCIARVWTWNSLLAIGLPACLPVVCFCACFLIIFYYSIPPGGMGRVNRKATLSLKTRWRSPKTVAKRKFHFLAVNPLAKDVVSIAQNCSETQISFSRGQPSR